ncbi:MAG: hypothetical protein ABWY63_00970 [Hyphomicrobiaceae bacterium]
MRDIVEWLRWQAGPRNIIPDHQMMLDAADEIERLRGVLAETVPDPEYRKMQDREIERLREEVEYWKHRYAKDHFPPRPQEGPHV